MLDNYNSTTNDIKIQPCSGGICKSHPKSQIIRTRIGSTKASNVLKENPKINGRSIVVLQVVNSTEGYVLVEYMYQSDYDAENVKTTQQKD